jgi:hypothetical protein
MALPGEIGWIGKDCPTHPKIASSRGDAEQCRVVRRNLL